jgi:amylosucrase
VLTAGGIPLIYLGDEIGTLNDHSYRDDPAHANDSRWVHRPRADWETYARRRDPTTIEGRIFQGLEKVIDLRCGNEAFAGGELEIIQTGNDHVLGYVRTAQGKRVVVFANFSEAPQVIPARVLEKHSVPSAERLHGVSQITAGGDLTMAPLDFVAYGGV